MARRHRFYRRARQNPLTETELIVGGVVALAVVGIGGYLLYKNTQASSSASLASGASTPPLSAYPNATAEGTSPTAAETAAAGAGYVVAGTGDN